MDTTPKFLLEQLNRRYATKKFDSSKKLTDKQITLLTDAIHLAPSSFGLQPFKTVIISNNKIKEQLLPEAFYQEKVQNCSHLFVFCRYTDITKKHINDYVAKAEEITKKPNEKFSDYKKIMIDSIESKSLKEKHARMTNQIYIAL